MGLVVALDVGSRSVKWVAVDAAPGVRPTLRRWGRTPLPAGTLFGNYNALTVEQPEALATALASAARAAGVVRGEAAVTFPDQFVKVFFTDLERLQDQTPRERDFTLWRIRQQLPQGLIKDAVLDYQHVSTTRRGTAPVCHLVVEAVRAAVLDEFARAVSAARTWPAWLNANSICCWNLFAAHLEAETPAETPLCLLHVGHYATTFSFHRNGVLEYLRILDYAWADFIRTRLRQGAAGEDAAEASLRAEPLVPAADGAAPAGPEALGAFKELFGEWFREVESTFAYHRAHFPYLERPRVWLCGGGATLPNVAPFLARLLDAPVALLDPALVVDVDGAVPAPELPERLGLAAALGAALTWGVPEATPVPTAEEATS